MKYRVIQQMGNKMGMIHYRRVSVHLAKTWKKNISNDENHKKIFHILNWFNFSVVSFTCFPYFPLNVIWIVCCKFSCLRHEIYNNFSSFIQNIDLLLYIDYKWIIKVFFMNTLLCIRKQLHVIYIDEKSYE